MVVPDVPVCDLVVEDEAVRGGAVAPEDVGIGAAGILQALFERVGVKAEFPRGLFEDALHSGVWLAVDDEGMLGIVNGEVGGYRISELGIVECVHCT